MVVRDVLLHILHTLVHLTFQVLELLVVLLESLMIELGGGLLHLRLHDRILFGVAFGGGPTAFLTNGRSLFGQLERLTLLLARRKRGFVFGLGDRDVGNSGLYLRPFVYVFPLVLRLVSLHL